MEQNAADTDRRFSNKNTIKDDKEKTELSFCWIISGIMLSGFTNWKKELYGIKNRRADAKNNIT